MEHTVHPLERFSNHRLARLTNVADERCYFFRLRVSCKGKQQQQPFRPKACAAATVASRHRRTHTTTITKEMEDEAEAQSTVTGR